jgi:hypothetical protein
VVLIDTSAAVTIIRYNIQKRAEHPKAWAKKNASSPEAPSRKDLPVNKCAMESHTQ